MDTTYLEYTAEDLIAHKLQRGGLLVTKPKFDRSGTDLIALLEVSDGAKFCRIQCKGRSLINNSNSNVKVAEEYVEGAFFVFLYIDAGDNEPHLFCFSSEEIKEHWNLKSNRDSEKSFYVLNFQKNSFLNPNSNSNLLKFSFSNDRIVQIKTKIKISVSNVEFQLFDIVKKQNELLDKKDELNRLKELITKIEHLNELTLVNDSNIKTLNEQYIKELSSLRSEIPKSLNDKMSKLLSKGMKTTEIISSIINDIPEGIPQIIIEDYISNILINKENT